MVSQLWSSTNLKGLDAYVCVKNLSSFSSYRIFFQYYALGIRYLKKKGLTILFWFFFLKASVERLVLVEDYDTGKSVAFDQRPQNLKDIYTSDGFRM